jgi:LysM repeat protein
MNVSWSINYPDNCTDNQSYVQKYKKIAVLEMHRSGIPASIKLAQAILESGAGKSDLAVKANNHFGIKCGGDWKGKTMRKKDDDYKFGVRVKSCFRSYKNPEQSFIDHTKFLTNPAKASRYGFLFDYDKKDYKKWAKGLKKAGYATNPKYPKLLIKVIEDNNLHEYDLMSIEDVGGEESPLADVKNKEVKKPRVKKPKVNRPSTEEPSSPKKPDFSKNKSLKNKGKASQNKNIFHVNDVKVVTVQIGDTPEKLAKRYKISKSKLLKYNDLSGSETLKVGTNIFLQSKRSSSRKKKNFHVVSDNETMHDISQMYGVKLSKLYKRNKMKAGQEPQNDERVNVRGKRYKAPKIRGAKQKTAKKEEKTKPKAKSSVQSKKEKERNAKSKQKNKPSKKDGIIHIVKEGETLYRISRKYQVSVDDIKKWNKLKTNNIDKGQELIINK